MKYCTDAPKFSLQVSEIQVKETGKFNLVVHYKVSCQQHLSVRLRILLCLLP